MSERPADALIPPCTLLRIVPGRCRCSIYGAVHRRSSNTAPELAVRMHGARDIWNTRPINTVAV